MTRMSLPEDFNPAIAMRQSREKYTERIARMAPSWMRIANVLPNASSSKPKKRLISSR